VFGSVGEHTKVAGICTKPGQFSQPCRAAGGRPAGACRFLSGRCKETFEFASKHLKRGKNLAEIAHREYTYIAGHNIIVRRNMASLRDGVKNRAGNFAIINATLSRPMSEMGHKICLCAGVAAGLPTVRCTPNNGPMWLAIGFFA
jgi:hypothetical protein